MTLRRYLLCHYLLIALAVLSGPAAAQTIYKCTSPAGQVSFQQAACPLDPAAKAQPIALREPNLVEGNPAGDAAVRASGARFMAVQLAIARGTVVAGMTEDEVRQVLGSPTVVNTDYVNGQINRQQVYRYADGSARYVYINQGGLYAVQTRPAPERIGHRR